MTVDTSQEACRAKKDEVTKGIVAALKVAGISYKLEKYRDNGWGWNATNYIALRGGVDVRVTEEHRFGRWNGKLRVKVSWLRQTKQFPERKNGFDYAAIASTVGEYISFEHEWHESAKRDEHDREQADDVEDRLTKDFPELLGNFSSGVRLWNHGRDNNFELRISHLNEETLRLVLAELGKIVKPDV